MSKISSIHSQEKSAALSIERTAEALTVKGQNLPTQLQTIPSQEVLKVIGPFFSFQQNLLVQMARSPIAQAFGLGGVATEHFYQRLLCCQVVLNHQAASENVVRLLLEAAKFSELAKRQGWNTPPNP